MLFTKEPESQPRQRQHRFVGGGCSVLDWLGLFDSGILSYGLMDFDCVYLLRTFVVFRILSLDKYYFVQIS